MRSEHDQQLVKEDGTIVSHMGKLVNDMNRQNLSFIIGQKEDTGQSLRVVEKKCSQHEEYVKEGDGKNLSHNKEKPVIEMNKENLTTRVSQNNGRGQLLKDV